ncbi:MAG: glycosyltransferase family 2 protein [Pseudomonadota bacterium]
MSDSLEHAEILTVIVVSYNTRDLTLKALETLIQNAGDVTMQIIVWDNDSHDGSPDAIAEQFHEVRLIRSSENIGFAAANNRAAELADTEWLLLLNPDTETHPNAIENLLKFARANPKAGIVGGRTVFPDGALNPASCWNRMSLWSLFCNASGLRSLMPNTSLFNPEGIGGWSRDSVRQVDIVVGCFLMIHTKLWRQLGGFNTKYFMYGEESDLCLRAAALGYRPMITPDAQIMHLVGASTPKLSSKVVNLMKAKATLIRDHWRPATRPLGIALLWLWVVNHRFASVALRRIKGSNDASNRWDTLWEERRNWLSGYSSDATRG